MGCRCISPMSYEDVSDFRPYRGNQFQKLSKDANGTPMLDSLGRPRTEPISEADAEGRFNYRRSDYRNYLDGDKESVFENGDRSSDPYDGSSTMYVQEGE